MTRSSQFTVHSSQLRIVVDGDVAVVTFGARRTLIALKKQPLLAGIEKVVREPGAIKGIEVRIKEATFSTTRQVIATVNTLVWVLGIKVNGKKQMSAKYDREPNITVKTK